jgi:hypothetical protein
LENLRMAIAILVALVGAFVAAVLVGSHKDHHDD